MVTTSDRNIRSIVTGVLTVMLLTGYLASNSEAAKPARKLKLGHQWTAPSILPPVVQKNLEKKPADKKLPEQTREEKKQYTRKFDDVTVTWRPARAEMSDPFIQTSTAMTIYEGTGYEGTGKWEYEESPAEHKVACASKSICRDCVKGRCCDSCVDCCFTNRNGTLFQWSMRPCCFSNKPNLNAPLITDRPSFTQASSTVGRGVGQIEFGYTYIYNSDDGIGTRVHSWGEPLLRYGIFADWLELRLGLNPLSERVRNECGCSYSREGVDDLLLGLKIALTPQCDYLPEMALIPRIFVPTGSDYFTRNNVRGGLNWIYSWDLYNGMILTGSTQFLMDRDDVTNESFTNWAQSFAVRYALAERLGGYSEWFALIPRGADTQATEHYLNTGLLYLITDNLQFDVRYGIGVNHAANDYFVGSGLSYRFR